MPKHQKNNSNQKISLKNRKTFNAVFTKFYAPLVLFASNFLNNSTEGAEDVVQDVFTNLLQKELEFNDIESLKAYLYMAIKNSCFNRHKHAKVKHLYAIAKKEIVKKDDFFLNKVLEEEVHFHLLKAINHLPNRCQEIFKLSIRGFKNTEIATTMNISVETVKSQKKRGKKILRGILRPVFYLF